jgi:hypothetical protein
MTPADTEPFPAPYPGTTHDATTRRADTWPAHRRKAKHKHQKARATALARNTTKEN